jgi:16S rRNA (uracil1498-N3)-methyltransferase
LVGQITIDQRQSHHLRDVLRLSAGETVELFDDAGGVASGVIASVDGSHVVVDVQRIDESTTQLERIVASAIPKGERADWLVEKLSELGVAEFIPLVSERSVVVPQGKNKMQRWQRIATESAKQSRRRGVMRIAEVRAPGEVIHRLPPSMKAIYLSTRADAQPIAQLPLPAETRSLLLLIGPEGGWTDREIDQFGRASVIGARLTGTILRVETAAIAAAAIVAAVLLPHTQAQDLSDNERGK